MRHCCYTGVTVNLIITVWILGKHARAQQKQTRISKTKNKTKEEKDKKKLNKNKKQIKTLVSVRRVSTAYSDQDLPSRYEQLSR